MLSDRLERKAADAELHHLPLALGRQKPYTRLCSPGSLRKFEFTSPHHSVLRFPDILEIRMKSARVCAICHREWDPENASRGANRRNPLERESGPMGSRRMPPKLKGGQRYRIKEPSAHPRQFEVSTLSVPRRPFRFLRHPDSDDWSDSTDD